MRVAATLDELTVVDSPDAWAALGFAVQDHVCVIGEARIRLAAEAPGTGAAGWSLRRVESI